MIQLRNIGLIVLVGLICFFKVYNFDYAIDDKVYITSNITTQKGLSGIVDAFTKSSVIDNEVVQNLEAYRPLTILSFMIDKTFFNCDSGLMHIENLLIYLFACIVLYFLLNLIFEDKKINLLLTLIFTALPVHQEVIGNIKSRDEILCLLFFLGSLYYFVRYYQLKNNTHIITAFFLWVLCLLSKERAYSMFVLFPLLQYLFFNQKVKSLIRSSILFLSPIILILIVRAYIFQNVPKTHILPLDNALLVNESFIVQKLNALYLIGVYVFKLIVPFPILWDYSIGHFTFNTNTLMVGLVVLISFLLLIYILFKKKKQLMLFGVLLFIFTFILSSNLLINIPTTFADRFLLIPSVGVLFLLYYLMKKYPVSNYISIGVIIIYCLININTIGSWRNDETIYTENKKYLKSYKSHLSYAATILELNKDIDRVPGLIEKAKQTVGYVPQYDAILGRYYFIKNDAVKCYFHFKRALDNNPNDVALRKQVENLEEHGVHLLK